MNTTATNIGPKRNNRRIFKFFVIVLTAIFGIGSFLIWRFADLPLVSPLSNLSSFNFLLEPDYKKEDKVVYGFLPYWNVDKVTVHEELTHLGYFSLRITSNGSLATDGTGDDATSFNRLKSDKFLDISEQMLDQNGKVELVLTQFNTEDIYAFLASAESQQNLLTSLDSVLLAYPFSGINIDIELSGQATPELRNQMSSFMQLINNHLDSRYKDIQLSVDVYAGAARGTGLWDIEAIEPSVDYIIVMAYDFHRKNSPQAGPVAPLFGGEKSWEADINHYLQLFVAKVPSTKILLGVPYYGYEWKTTSRDPQSHTFPDTGVTASIERVDELLKQKDELQVQEGWNEDALSPYLSYSKDGNIYVIYFENSRSLSYKLDYVNQLELGGIAIWALGYEGNSRDLWEVIQRKVLL